MKLVWKIHLKFITGYDPVYKEFCEIIKRKITGLSLFYLNKNNKLKPLLPSSLKDASEVSDLKESLDDLKRTNSSATVTLNGDLTLLQPDIFRKEKASMVHSNETIVKATVTQYSPNPNVSITAAIDYDKILDIPSSDGKSFYATPKKYLTAQEEIGILKKDFTDAKINNGDIQKQMQQKLEEQQRELLQMKQREERQRQQLVEEQLGLQKQLQQSEEQQHQQLGLQKQLQLEENHQKQHKQLEQLEQQQRDQLHQPQTLWPESDDEIFMD